MAATKTLENSDLKEELSIAYNTLAESYYHTNAQDLAITYNIKALALQEQLKDSSGVNKTYQRLSDLYYKKKEHKKSIFYFEKLLSLKGYSDTLRASIYPKLGGGVFGY
ncbi:hypothetical protein JCM19274_1465 [Algibacter lectus]|uniref:Uncharacterized protein n=1 Tax=Algibacter lectus TaxID=221126 RepID=A0A090WZH9_9FLAO|nr:tetratricopeptide repeat protein [Algibacter lectus]GAL80839.1 hypothetical protein JCM19274_1465 [Algibacter lectus]